MSHPLAPAVETLSQAYLQRYPAEINDWLNHLPLEQALGVFETLALPTQVRAWERLPLALADDLFRRLAPERAAELLERVESTRAAQLLRRFSEAQREEWLGRVKRTTARELTRLMRFAAGSAGALMDPHPPALHQELTVGEALERLRARKWRVTRALYIIDEAGKLLCQADIQDLALADPQTPLLNLCHPTALSVTEVTARDEISELLERQKLLELPVLDAHQRLVGVIHYQSLISAMQATVSADIQTMVGVSEDERALSPASFAVRKRLPWLQINLATAFLAAAVVGLFEDVIAQVTALAVLLPIVAGQSGNTGAQALAVTMRGLALREVSVRHWLHLLRKEVGAGFVNGVAVAAVTALAIGLWSGSHYLALVIAVSMVLAMVAACIAGTLIPILLTRAGQDPAQSSSIILTTVTDVVGFFAFLGIAALFMPYL